MCYYRLIQSFWLNVGINIFPCWLELSKKLVLMPITFASGCKTSVTILTTFCLLDCKVIRDLGRVDALREK